MVPQGGHWWGYGVEKNLNQATRKLNVNLEGKRCIAIRRYCYAPFSALPSSWPR